MKYEYKTGEIIEEDGTVVREMAVKGEEWV